MAVLLQLLWLPPSSVCRLRMCVCICLFFFHTEGALLSPKDCVAPARHWLRIPGVAMRDWPALGAETSKLDAAQATRWIAIAEASTKLRDCAEKICV